MTASTRVMVQNIPPMLRDIVRSVVASAPDMMLLSEHSGTGTAYSWRRPEPDVVIVSTEDINDISSTIECFSRWPRARVLVIEVTGRETVLYELRPHATPLGALSPDQLVATIRMGSEIWERNEGSGDREEDQPR
jgi:DNA-binding NarL/FixJ family response regulator